MSDEAGAYSHAASEHWGLTFRDENGTYEVGGVKDDYRKVRYV